VIATAASSPGVLAPTGATAIRAIRAPLPLGMSVAQSVSFDIPAPAQQMKPKKVDRCSYCCPPIQQRARLLQAKFKLSQYLHNCTKGDGASTAQQYVCDPRGKRTMARVARPHQTIRA